MEVQAIKKPRKTVKLYGKQFSASLFEQWFSQCLLPALPEHSVIIMDNASFHRKKKLNVLARKALRSLFSLVILITNKAIKLSFWGCLHSPSGAVHHNKKLIKVFIRKQYYSLELNPIEHFWSWLKGLSERCSLPIFLLMSPL